MSNELAAAVESILSSLGTSEVVATSAQGLNKDLWLAFAESGFTGVGVPETVGGSGGELSDAAAVIGAAARSAAPLPLVETLQSGLLSARLGIPFSPSAYVPVIDARSASTVVQRAGDGWLLTTRVPRVPWGRDASRFLVIAPGDGGPVAALVDSASSSIDTGVNLADEPRDDVSMNKARASEVFSLTEQDADEHLLVGALGRSVQIADALQGVLTMTVQYAMVREQFGRPIGKFQAIQQMVAELAAACAAASVAADAAVRAMFDGDATAAIASAKIRSGMAAGVGARIAHQVHGTLGFTREHRLQQLTRRLWSWRDEYGSEQHWASLLGARSSAAPDVWAMLTEMLEG